MPNFVFAYHGGKQHIDCLDHFDGGTVEVIQAIDM